MTAWAIAKGKGQLEEYAKSYKIQVKLYRKLVKMVVDLSSEQKSVLTDLINKSEINHRDKDATICSYGDDHPYTSALARLEIAMNDRTIMRKTVNVGLVPSLAVDVLVVGDF